MIDWSDKYSIAIPAIDEQHKFFFQAVHRLHKECAAEEGADAVLETLVFLENYAKRHFRDEEKLMRKFDYPKVEQHSRLHAEFLREYSTLADEFDELGPSQYLAERMGELVQEWLIEHIATADMGYARHILGDGETR